MFIHSLFINNAYSDARHGQQLFGEAQTILGKSVYSRSYDGTETITINEMRLTKSADGNLTLVLAIWQIWSMQLPEKLIFSSFLQNPATK